MTSTVANSRGVVDQDTAARVRAILIAIGEKAAADRLGMGRTTLARIAGGLPVQRGSMLVCQTALPAVEAGLAATVKA